jgi:regulator of sigma E protease
LSFPVVVAVAAVFGLLISFHEFGHFLLAKINGVRVLEFSVGFGQPLLQHHGRDTTYSLRLVPLGGFVRLAGMDDGDTSPQSFNAKPVWRRVSIIVAGAVFNLILPVAVFYGIAAAETGQPVVAGAVSVALPADAGGIKPGDELLAVNGQQLTSVTQFRDLIAASGGKPLTIRYRHPGFGPQEGTLQPLFIQGRWRIGVGPQGPATQFDLVGSFRDSVIADRDAIATVIGGFGTLLFGRIPGGVGGPCGLSGPVGIVRTTAHFAEAGWGQLLAFTAFLSVNLGILNLLPLPALDGGRLAFLLIEAVRGKPVDSTKEQKVHYFGLAVLFAAIALITYNDVLRLGTPFATLINRCAQ